MVDTSRTSARTPASPTRASSRATCPGALRAMRAAREVAGTPADVAWASFQIGELQFNRGRRRGTPAAYRYGLRGGPQVRARPGRAGQGGVGRAATSTPRSRGYRGGHARYPSPEYVIALGDLERAPATDAAARAAVRAGARGGAAVPRERRERRPGARAVRRRPRRARAALAAARARVGSPPEHPRGRRATRGRSTRTAATRRPRGTRRRRWRSARATRSSPSTPGMIQLRLGHRAAAARLPRRGARDQPALLDPARPTAARALARLGGADETRGSLAGRAGASASC